jgi:hypothetical protein
LERDSIQLTFKIDPIWNFEYRVLWRNSIFGKRSMRGHHGMKSSDAISNFELICLLDVGAKRMNDSSNVISAIERFVYRREVVPICLSISGLILGSGV